MILFNNAIEIRKKEIFDKNIEQLLLDEKRLHEKITKLYNSRIKYLDCMTLEEYKEYVIKQLENKDINTIILFIKDFTRQNIYEPVQIDLFTKYLNNNYGKLFKTEIIFRRYNKKKTTIKSFDGIDSNNKIICNCKYINESGGSQDNQFNDLITFNREFKEYKYNFLIVSGNYGIKKIRDYLKNNVLVKNTYVVIMDDEIEIIPNLNNTRYYSINNEIIIDMKENLQLIFTYDIDTVIYEPFCGNCDLINMIKENKIEFNENNLKLFDLEGNDEIIIKKDTLLDCCWKNQNHIFVLTNPPYTAKNKLTQYDKDKYKKLINNCSDLYQIFIKQLIQYPVDFGLIIIPSNFLFGQQTTKLRKQFIDRYFLINVNIFEKKIFEETTQSTVSILFINNSLTIHNLTRKINLIRDNEIINLNYEYFETLLEFDLEKHYSRKINDDSIDLIRYYHIPNEYFKTNIKINLIDYNMKAEYIETKDIKEQKLTDRSFIIVCSNKNISKEKQLEIIESFNNKLSRIRLKTHSLCLTSFREFTRKRLTIKQSLTIMKYIMTRII